MAINEKLRELRGDRTIVEVAKLSGVPKSTLQTIEAGKCVPSIKTLRKLADFYGVQVSDIAIVRQKREIRVMNHPARILDGIMGDRFYRIADDIRAGVSPAIIRDRYGMDGSTYEVYVKILKGGLTAGNYNSMEAIPIGERVYGKGAKAVELHEAGYSVDDIVTLTGLMKKTVQKYIRDAARIKAETGAREAKRR